MFSRLHARFLALSPLARRISLLGACGTVFIGVAGGVGAPALEGGRAPVAGSSPPAVVLAPEPNVLLDQLVADSLLGRSGKLMARFVAAPLASSYPYLAPATGSKPGMLSAAMPASGERFSFFSVVPFAQKFGDRVGSYLVGYWPGELRAGSDDEENPVGFIEVTEENVNTPVSEHFVLGDFLTHDQQKGWPRYVVIQEPLLDKLELVIAELKRSGIPVSNVRVLSGFRTPYHNLYGIGSEGGARDSRHQYGDGADIIIDNNRDGRMDDLNRDRRVDVRDLELVLQAVERVERTYPELVGGLGKYHAVGPSGPFAHIDVRGYKARWNNDRKTAVATATAQRGSQASVQRSGQALKVGRCNAAPEFAALCGGD